MDASATTNVMNLSAIRKRPGALACFAMFVAGIWHNLLARVRKWAPLGYEDETGFHLGLEKSQD
jgi:hypothetical protein